MLRTLLESQATTRRPGGSTMLSVAVHVGAIALAIVATANATTPLGQPEHLDGPIVVWTPPSPLARGAERSSRDREYRDVVVPDHRVIVPDIWVPDQHPAIDVDRPSTNNGDFDASREGLTSGNGFGGPASLVSPMDGVYTPALVDKAAAPLPDNPVPVYPASLRSAQIEGMVLATFVVDTTGRAEPATIQFREATHPQFAEAVRQSLLRSRYLPAVVRGRPVRQLVEQRFAFALTR